MRVIKRGVLCPTFCLSYPFNKVWEVFVHMLLANSVCICTRVFRLDLVLFFGKRACINITLHRQKKAAHVKGTVIKTNRLQVCLSPG